MEILKRMWKRRKIESSLLTCVVLLVTRVSSSSLVEENLTLRVNVRKPLSIHGDKFLSVAIDPLAILASKDVTENYEKSVKLFGALSPAYLRLGGPRSNAYSLDDRNDTSYVFSEENWNRLHRWAARTGLDVIACISAKFMENDNGVDLVSLTDRMGFDVSWQLGYECQTRCDLAGSEMGKYVRILREKLDAIPRYSNSIITGPDVVAYGTGEQREYLEKFLSEAGDALTAVTWHPDFASVTRNDDDVLVHRDRLSSAKIDLEDAIGSEAAKKPLWIAESRPEPSRNQYLGALVWTNRLGNAAKLGVQVLMRQPSDLAKATPDYWVSLLHKRLVGREVFDVKIQTANKSQVHFYAQCTKPSAIYERGALTIFGVNLTPTKIRASIKGLKLKTLHEYVLMPGFDAPNRMFSERVLLNGKPLNLINGTELPDTEGVTLNDEKGSSIELPSGGIGFWVVPDLKIKSCMDRRDETGKSKEEARDRTDRKNSPKEEEEKEEDNEIRRKKRLIDHRKTSTELRKMETRKEEEKLGKILKRRFARREGKTSTSSGESLVLFGYDPNSTAKRSRRDLGESLEESRKADREYKPKDDVGRNVRPWMLSRSSKEDNSDENNFYGFFGQEPTKNFPESDVFLATDDSKEREESTKEKISINIGDDFRGYVSNEFFGTDDDAFEHGRRSKRKLEDSNAILEREMIIDEDNDGNWRDCRCRLVRNSRADSEPNYPRTRRNANENEEEDVESREENEERVEGTLDREIIETPTIEASIEEDELSSNEKQFFRGEYQQPQETTTTIHLDEDRERDTSCFLQDTTSAPEENNSTIPPSLVLPEKGETTENSSGESSGASSRDEKEATSKDSKNVEEAKIALKREIPSGKVTKSLGSPKEISKGSKRLASSSRTKTRSNSKASETPSALKRESISEEKHRDHRRERTEKVEMLRRRLVAKREEILRRYEEELLDAMKRNAMNEKRDEREEEKRKRKENRRNLKREIWEKLRSTDADREKVAYVLTYDPINYDRSEKEEGSEKIVKDERRYIPIVEITRPLYRIEEKLIDEPAKMSRYLRDPRVTLYARSDGSNSRTIQSKFPYDIIGERERYGGDRVASGKRYYALVDSAEEDPWMFQYQRRSKESQRNVYESGGGREKQPDGSVRTYETPVRYVYEESDETIDETIDESSNSRSTGHKIYAIDPSTYKGGEPELEIHEDFEESSVNDNENSEQFYRVILKNDKADKNAPILYILDEKRQHDSREPSDLATYILGRRHVEKESDVENNSTIFERDVTEATEKLETKENVTGEIDSDVNSREKLENIEETSEVDSNEEGGTRTRRDVEKMNSVLINKIPLLLMRKAPYDKNRKTRSESSDYFVLNDDQHFNPFRKLIKRLDSFESLRHNPKNNVQRKSIILLPETSERDTDFYDNKKRYESSSNDHENEPVSNDLPRSQFKFNKSPILAKHIYAHIKEGRDKNEKEANELWEFKSLPTPKQENNVDTIQNNERKDDKSLSSSFLQGALPKLQEVITDGFDKAQNLTESLDQFVEGFEKNFNEDENKNETLKRSANTATQDIFQTAITNVKKFFAFLGGVTRIFYG